MAMHEGVQPGFAWTADRGTFGIPAMAVSMWVGALRWNVHLHEGIGSIAHEWQNFVSGRVREDFAFMRRMAHSRTPDQIWAAYAEFWQKAVDDYGKEYMIMGRLVAEATSKSVGAAQLIEDATAVSRASRIG